VCEAGGGAAAQAERAAAALELVHTYSLVHDDLPAMDDDELRRGRPTCHVVFGEATAILVGDGLQALAFEVLAEDPHAAQLVGVLARAAGSAGMVGGQSLDLRSADRGPGVEGLLDVHARKTAALFEAASEMGAVCAGGAATERTAAREYGRALGMTFQATDDVLDVTGDARTLGKTPGKDEALERQTLVAWCGLEGARRLAGEAAERARAAARELGAAEGDPLLELPRSLLARGS
jgi:geranylgeranyl diphosphate synthase type II